MAWLRAVRLNSHVSDARLARLLDVVPHRREALARRRPEDALRSIAGELLARAMIARHAGAAVAEFSVGPHGKPEIVSPAGWHHNVSHSGDWVACALDDAAPIGVDVEAVRDVDLGVAKRFFHAEERRQLAALPAEARPTAFFDIWSAKESYVKALGVGIGAELASFWVDLDRGVVSGGEPGWHIHRTPLDDGHRLATCTRAPSPPSVEISDADDLLAAALSR